jgi:hypothetical protein
VEVHQPNEEEMESSFKKGYEKNVLPDGSVELNYKAKRISPSVMASAGVLAIFILFPASCAVTLPFAAMFNDANQSLGQTSKGLWMTLALVLYIVILYFFVNTKATLTIKPNEGLLFLGKQLPFSEIQNMGTIDHPNARSKAGAAFVYAESHGKQINITKYIPLSLAEAIEVEIKSVSHSVWKG